MTQYNFLMWIIFIPKIEKVIHSLRNTGKTKLKYKHNKKKSKRA